MQLFAIPQWRRICYSPIPAAEVHKPSQEVTYPRPLLRYSPGNLRAPTSMPNPTPKHSPTAMSRTTSAPCNPLMRGLFRLLNSANTPSKSKNAKMLNLVFFHASPLRKVVHRVSLALFPHYVSLEGPEKGDTEARTD